MARTTAGTGLAAARLGASAAAGAGRAATELGQAAATDIARLGAAAVTDAGRAVTELGASAATGAARLGDSAVTEAARTAARLGPPATTGAADLGAAAVDAGRTAVLGVFEAADMGASAVRAGGCAAAVAARLGTSAARSALRRGASAAVTAAAVARVPADAAALLISASPAMTTARAGASPVSGALAGLPGGAATALVRAPAGAVTALMRIPSAAAAAALTHVPPDMARAPADAADRLRRASADAVTLLERAPAAGAAALRRLPDGLAVTAARPSGTERSSGTASARRVWCRDGHAHVEVRIPAGDDRDRFAADVTSALRAVPGVRRARLNAVTGQVMLALDGDVAGPRTLVRAVTAVEEAYGTAGTAFARDRPALPGDRSAERSAAVVLAADVAGLAAATAGRLARVPTLPAVIRLPVAFADAQPRVRGALERRLGPLPAERLLGLAGAVTQAATQDAFALAVDTVHRALRLSELRARRATWEARAPELIAASAAPAAPAPGPRPAPMPPGPIERAADRSALAGLTAAGGVLAWSRDPGRATDILLATVPKAARLGREAFAAVIGRELAAGGLLPMDPAALRRLDRISAIVVDSAALCAGDELHPLADAVVGAARTAADRLLLTAHPVTAELAPWADDTVPARGLAGTVRELQAEGHGVLLLAAADDAALAAADVGVAVGGRRVCWSAHLIGGAGLEQVWRLLRAVPAARLAAERASRFTVGGAALGALLATVGPAGSGRRRLPGPFGRGVAPGHAATALAVAAGAIGARRAVRTDAPVARPRARWHAVTADEALRRLVDGRPDDARGRAGPAGHAREGGDAGGRDAGFVARIGAVPGAGGAALAAARGTAELGRAVAEELRDPLTPVLALGAAASAVVGSGVDALLVGGVMAGNAVVSGAQRMRAERALRALLLRERLTARRLDPAGAPADGRTSGLTGAPAYGRRADGPAYGGWRGPAGVPVEAVPADRLVAGDVIELRPSDVVPADARLLSADRLEVDESTLTGESLPVAKDTAPCPGADIADRACMVYEGTTVVAGSAHAVVTATGSATESGRAALAAGRAAPPAGVQAQLSELTRITLPATGAAGLAVTGLSLLRRIPLRQAVSSGIATAVAAVPEGLPLVATAAQLAAARRLSRRGILVRSSRTLEALGRVDTFCFDKTGTLTEGRLSVTRLAVAGRTLDAGDPRGRSLLRTAARACPHTDDAGALTHATDRAIVTAALDRLGPDGGWRPVEELPFETNRGYAASLGVNSSGPVVAVKGAPEVVLAHSGAVVDEDGTAAELTPARRRRAKAQVRRLAADGLRVIAVARARTGDGATDLERLGTELTLLGFVGIADTPRPDADRAVRRLTDAGVRVTIITGDHPVTAAAIAARLGIPDADRVLTGTELDTMTERERLERIPRTTVFARVSPEQKVRVVQALQRRGHVVAMTGDGANDAAAIRLADVGIGVSGRGSTSARTAADLVLSAPDPDRLADALAEGRSLWARVRDAVSILVGGNAGEVAFTLLGTALHGRAPLNTRQLLLVNMLTDMLPALAVALGPAAGPAAGADELLATGPETLWGPSLARTLAVRGGATALGATAAWHLGRVTGRRRRADTMGLAALVSTQLGQTLLMGRRSPLVLGTAALSALCLFLIVETPVVSRFFGSTPLGPVAWAIVAASSAAATAGSALAPRLLDRGEAAA